MPARFFVRDGIAPTDVGSMVELPEDVAHHAIRVARIGTGDTLALFDGAGGEYRATLVEITRRSARARIDAYIPADREPALAVTLVMAIVATDAMDYGVRKAVELGARAIEPVITARSAPMPAGDRAQRRHAHWREIAIAACEQCGRNRIPDVRMPIALQAYAPDADETLLVCAPVSSAPSLSTVELAASRCAIAIGPEGGWTDSELAALTQRGATLVQLGPRVLRADTAAVTALAIIQARWGDLR